MALKYVISQRSEGNKSYEGAFFLWQENVLISSNM